MATRPARLATGIATQPGRGRGWPVPQVLASGRRVRRRGWLADLGAALRILADQDRGLLGAAGRGGSGLLLALPGSGLAQALVVSGVPRGGLVGGDVAEVPAQQRQGSPHVRDGGRERLDPGHLGGELGRCPRVFPGEMVSDSAAILRGAVRASQGT